MYNHKYGLSQQQHKSSPDYEEFGNDLTNSHVQHHRPQQQVHRDQYTKNNYGIGSDNQLVELIQIGLENLPCAEELTDPTELPLSRESIGMDLSWLSGNANRSISNFLILLLFILISCLLS